MFRSKFGFNAICGTALLLFALSQLSFEYNNDAQSIFIFSWLAVAVLFVAANWRQMMKYKLVARLQKERERRALWLEAQKQLPSRRRGRVTQRV